MGGGREQNSGNASQKVGGGSFNWEKKGKKGFGKAPKIKFISIIIIICDVLTAINK